MFYSVILGKAGVYHLGVPQVYLKGVGETRISRNVVFYILFFGQAWGAMTDIGIMYYIGSMIEESCNIMYPTLQMAKT